MFVFVGDRLKQGITYPGVNTFSMPKLDPPWPFLFGSIYSYLVIHDFAWESFDYSPTNNFYRRHL